MIHKQAKILLTWTGSAVFCNDTALIIPFPNLLPFKSPRATISYSHFLPSISSLQTKLLAEEGANLSVSSIPTPPFRFTNGEDADTSIIVVAVARILSLTITLASLATWGPGGVVLTLIGPIL